MSFDINWETLVGDNVINQGIKDFLHEQFQTITLPTFISDLSVTDFDLGKISPNITIRHISNPFNEFYDENLQNIDERLRNLSNKYSKRRSSFVDDSSDEDNDSTNASTFSEDDIHKPDIDGSKDVNQIPKRPQLDQTIIQSRNSLDSISLMLGKNNLSFLHNHNLNGLGIGTITTPSTQISARPDTPSNILNMRDKPPFIRSKEVSGTKDENDIQLIIEFDYHGDVEIGITVNLLVNYPSPNFICLPIKLRITDLVIHSLAVIAYLQHAVYVSFLCDINEQSSDYFTSSNTPHKFSSGDGLNYGGNFVDYVSNGNTHERIDIIKKVKIESEIGVLDHNALRNVGKVEKFLIEQFRRLLRDEIAWPNWICLDLNPETDDDNDDD